jgi:hypothetical protein
MVDEKDKDLVSIETPDRDLDELMLQEYPGRIFEKNRKVRTIGNKKSYCYYGIEKREFEKFISSKPDIFSYRFHKFIGYPSETDKMKGVSMN